MLGLLKNLTNNFFLWGAIFLLWFVGGCHTNRAPLPMAPYLIKKVDVSTIDLPVMIIETPQGRKKVHPSVWNAKTLKFSDGIPQKIKVKKGDSLFSLSNKYAVPLPMIIEINHLTPPFSIYLGQDLILLGPKVHIVQEGEDLYKISEMHQVSLSSLMRQNNLTPNKPPQVGQKIILPAPQAGVATSEIKKTRLKQSSDSLVGPAVSLLPLKSQELILGNHIHKAKVRFAFPLKGQLVSKFGPKGHGLYNDGINIAAPKGSKIKAAEDGTVVYLGNEIKSYGTLILIKHADGWMTAYAHLDKVIVHKGQEIRQKDILGFVGSSGFVKDPQLHFELRKDGKPIDPLLYLQ